MSNDKNNRYNNHYHLKYHNTNRCVVVCVVNMTGGMEFYVRYTFVSYDALHSLAIHAIYNMCSIYFGICLLYLADFW